MTTNPNDGEAEIIPFTTTTNNEESAVADTEVQDRGITLTFTDEAEAQLAAMSDPEKAPYGVPGHAGRLRQKIDQGLYSALIERSVEVPLTTVAGDVRSIVRNGVTFLFTVKIPPKNAKNQDAKVNVVAVFFQPSSTPHGSPNHPYPIDSDGGPDYVVDDDGDTDEE